MLKSLKKFLILFFLSVLVVLTSSCSTDRLITRKNHDADYQYCWQRITETRGNAVLLKMKVDNEIRDYQILIEEILTARERALKLTNWISDNIEHDRAIPPHMLDKLNYGMTRGLELSDKVVSVVARNECWLQATNDKLEGMNLLQLDQNIRHKGTMLALSATLMLYDTYFTTASLLNEHDRIRQFLNQSDVGYGKQEDQLKAVTDTMLKTENLLLVQKEIKYFEDGYLYYDSHLRLDAEASYLSALIKQSPAYPVLRNTSLDDLKEQQEIFESAQLEDSLLKLNRDTVNGISKLFGNLFGLVEERKGKLYENKESYTDLIMTLKAGDILLEKTPFRLTDKMIPGHWGHAAIWVGSEIELKELGIWNHPIVINYHNEILSSQAVVEALRSGVEMNTLAHFMNIDDIAIIRDPVKTKEETAARIIRTLRQVGKEYDFNYNVETTDKIVCSQLVYLAYTDIEWPTRKVIGRYTISPDNVANKAINSGPLNLVLFYHDGKRIEDRPESLMEKLMGKNEALN